MSVSVRASVVSCKVVKVLSAVVTASAVKIVVVGAALVVSGNVGEVVLSLMSVAGTPGGTVAGRVQAVALSLVVPGKHTQDLLPLR
uniref:Uncharacterized protein n=1 Tax=Ixodes ricinus TaxID=34613 RepID=A0A6B0TYQ7_IXORI